jgi:hypothetical protein
MRVGIVAEACVTPWEGRMGTISPNVATPKPGVEANVDLTDDNALERVAIAGATAIQRIIAERDSLRNRVHVQQQDLVALSDINKELRDRVALAHHHYIEIAKMIISHLEKFDRATRDGLRDTEDIQTSDLAALVALANRLKPNNSPSPTDEGQSSER